MPRSHYAKIRLTAAERGAWQRRARAAGLPMAAWVRRELATRGALPRHADAPRRPAPAGHNARQQQRQPLTAFVRIRVSEADRADLDTAAAAAGMTLGTYARRRLLGHPVIAAADAATVRELRRQGGLLKQVHTESKGAYRRETAAALAELRKVIERIGTRQAEDVH